MVVSDQSEDNGGVKEFQFQKLKHETKWETFKRAIYDPETKSVLGRTGKSWGQLLLFYAIFYAVLAALFAICMQGLFATLSDTQPTWTLDKSLIGTNPGLGFRPISKRTEEGSLIVYNMTNQTEVNKWVDLIDEFLIPYKANQAGKNYVTCDFDKPPAEGKVCVSDLSKLGNCNKDRAYGYNGSSPCIFLKLNKIFGWKPEYYTEVHPDMPKELKLHIEENTKNVTERQQVWVSCTGVDDIDKEHVQSFNYYPHGFASYYYPYQNYPNYISPIIAVELVNVKTNIIISVECRAWAKNIEYKGGSLKRAGSVQFEIQVDDDASL
ncbi:sodium/potassium-transporting ATPase subunit beta-1 [Anthonomus grandis grandis]|uniref:sodium/potassium-transporting ATPase subunit beta-1 n=1 Tax=Anthonomus grandis grandis TaxID=2921223 RepID=UPI0021655DDF|nr:sodium/potassium-transporting ATPase subunit beta-1 [Anthonomus grandis grandis]